MADCTLVSMSKVAIRLGKALLRSMPPSFVRRVLRGVKTFAGMREMI